MKKLISCEYSFDNCCVELKFNDGSMIAIDTIAVENEVADNMYQPRQTHEKRKKKQTSVFWYNERKMEVCSYGRIIILDGIYRRQ